MTREEVDLFGQGDLVFGCRHLPDQAPVAGVLVCPGPPFDGGPDEGRSARLARRLAAAGVAVQRFRHRGAWPSDGDLRDASFAGLVEDAGAALALLRERAGVTRVGFVGARLGALVAARLARDVPGAPMVVWAPVADGRSALERAARARAARRLHGGRSSPAPAVPWPAGPVPGTTGGGWAEAGVARPSRPAALAGAPPVPDLFEAPLAADLAGGAVGSFADELGPRPRDLLVVDTGDEGWDDEREAVVASCRGRGLAVDVAKHPCDAERDGRVVPLDAGDELVDDTVGWLLARLGPGHVPPSGPGGAPPGGTAHPPGGAPGSAW
ncbi:MAG TPA: alpha/beta hydrolase [Acidimicrobiales bacterium]|nr:alpha/beta hydrolase [Acidimicrobiales bacterium]